MATANPLTASPTTIPQGGQATGTVTFITDPGTPDKPADLVLVVDGVEKQRLTGLIEKGIAAEPTPVVKAGNTNVGWELRATAGTLTVGPGNQFTLRNP